MGEDHQLHLIGPLRSVIDHFEKVTDHPVLLLVPTMRTYPRVGRYGRLPDNGGQQLSSQYDIALAPENASLWAETHCSTMILTASFVIRSRDSQFLMNVKLLPLDNGPLPRLRGCLKPKGS